MKAVIVERPGVLAVKDIPNPEMGPYDALVRVVAGGVCSGTDNHVLEGTHFDPIEYPTVLGHESIGAVVSVGAKVKYFQEGDLITRIFNRLPAKSGYSLYHGGFAEYGIATDWKAMQEDGHDEKVWKAFTVHRVLPKDTDPIEAVMLITWRETHAFLKRMEPDKHGRILIIGSGGNALALLDHCRILKCKVAVIGNPQQKQLFLQSGAEVFVSYKNADICAGLEKSGLQKVNTILDAVGNPDTTDAVLSFLEHRGRLGVYGLNEYNSYTLNMTRSQGDFTYFDGTMYDEGSSHDDVIALMDKSLLDPWKYLSKDHIYPLEKINAALQAVAKRKVIKSIVSFDREPRR